MHNAYTLNTQARESMLMPGSFPRLVRGNSIVHKRNNSENYNGNKIQNGGCDCNVFFLLSPIHIRCICVCMPSPLLVCECLFVSFTAILLIETSPYVCCIQTTRALFDANRTPTHASIHSRSSALGVTCDIHPTQF